MSEGSILVTGGLGYIGSHVVRTLLEAYKDVIIVDSSTDSTSIGNYKEDRNLTIYTVNLHTRTALVDIFEAHKITTVIHLAALKSVAESMRSPLLYYNANVQATLTLLSVMEEFDCKNLIYSSSATVYEPGRYRRETDVLHPSTVYGKTKRMVEEILVDLNNIGWKCVTLRYFNPIGCADGIEYVCNGNNLIDNIITAYKNNAEVVVYGNDYNTTDGTAVRDYVHVEDVADVHLSLLTEWEALQHRIYNVGTGVGLSVLDIINSCGVKYRIEGRRDGDVEEYTADVDRLYEELNWKANRDVREAIINLIRSVKD